MIYSYKYDLRSFSPDGDARCPCNLCYFLVLLSWFKYVIDRLYSHGLKLLVR